MDRCVDTDRCVVLWALLINALTWIHCGRLERFKKRLTDLINQCEAFNTDCRLQQTNQWTQQGLGRGLERWLLWAVADLTIDSTGLMLQLLVAMDLMGAAIE